MGNKYLRTKILKSNNMYKEIYKVTNMTMERHRLRKDLKRPFIYILDWYLEWGHIATILKTKQTQGKNPANAGEGGEPDFQTSHLIISKCKVFKNNNKKITWHSKKQERHWSQTAVIYLNLDPQHAMADILSKYVTSLNANFFTCKMRILIIILNI